MCIEYICISLVEPTVIPPGAFGGGKPPPPRVVNTDFYRGKVKSIYEREPLFQVILAQYDVGLLNHYLIMAFGV